MRENTDQNNSEYGHFLRSVKTVYKCDTLRYLVPFVQFKKRKKNHAWSLQLYYKRFQHRCFPVNFAKFLRTSFIQNTSGGLLWIVKQANFT